MQHLSPFTVMLIINLEPLYGILLSLAIWGEEELMSFRFYAGFIIILGSILLNGILDGIIPEELIIALVDIQTREVLYDFIINGLEINKESPTPYDIKLVAGDQEYVNMTVQEILNNIQIEFSLGQNYPNPFNPITKINYTLPKHAKVNVSIYNVLGQKVVTLLDKKQEYGYHTLTWNGTNSFGKQMATGVYFAKMSAGKFTQTKKMLLLK